MQKHLQISSLLLGFAVFLQTAHAVTVPPNDGFVTDVAGILATADEQALEQKLTQYKASTSNEIAVLILPSLHGEDIAEASVEIGRSWGVGSKEYNNGILILIDYEGREVFLATGYGLEGAVPDIVAKGIIDTDLTPHFRDGDYIGGLNAAVDSLAKHIGGEYTAERYENTGSDVSFSPALFFFGFMLLQWMFAIMARSKSWWAGGIFGGIGGLILAVIFTWWISIPILVFLGLLLDYIISKNFKSRAPTAWWAGGNWGPGTRGGIGGPRGGGGFGGFGGGSFGGGGARGKW